MRRSYVVVLSILSFLQVTAMETENIAGPFLTHLGPRARLLVDITNTPQGQTILKGFNSNNTEKNIVKDNSVINEDQASENRLQIEPVLHVEEQIVSSHKKLYWTLGILAFISIGLVASIDLNYDFPKYPLLYEKHIKQ